MPTFLPSQLADAIHACVLSCTLTVTPGHYADLTLRNLSPPEGATIVLTGSTFTSVQMVHDANLTVRGGTVSGKGAGGKCWYVDWSSKIALYGNRAEGCSIVGFVLNRSTDVTLDDWTAIAMGCDAVDIVGVNIGKVTNGRETGSNGGGACHPDAVQGWSYGASELQHIVISGNVVVSGDFMMPDGRTRGQMGYDIFNNNGPNGTPLPIDDVEVTNNTVSTHGGFCAAMMHITHLVVKGNRCFNLKPEPWKARYYFMDSSGVLGPNEVDGRRVWTNASR